MPRKNKKQKRYLRQAARTNEVLAKKRQEITAREFSDAEINDMHRELVVQGFVEVQWADNFPPQEDWLGVMDALAKRGQCAHLRSFSH